MWVVVGLGNPGPRYAHTRHNAGFLVTELLARRWQFALEFDASGRWRSGRGSVRGVPAVLMQPHAFMNRSGEGLTEWVAADDQVVAVFDDLDLPVGSLRIRDRGGAGGHRGVASLLAHLGDRFFRVRVGIGRPPASEDVATYVLAPLTPEEAVALSPSLDRAADAVECLLVDGPSVAMNRFNVRPPASASASV